MKNNQINILIEKGLNIKDAWDLSISSDVCKKINKHLKKRRGKGKIINLKNEIRA